jgi:pimeloyl-ACP methyl ester carboxylesterase
MWDAVTDKLAMHFRCIVPDLTGHGQSDGDKNTTLKLMASEHAELMAQLGIEEYYFVGLSIGAMWGALLLSSNNIKINKFVVMTQV